ncbi:tRNA wybutosine-synthesizing protein 5-like [Ruditapes philippinarum]|uniref:tRNA wybutosine-synthesizing protein 5-like n=1 Tax=Ruditapes philippinarum TaxID=129788 RepID=UPI00295C27C0|nr:tRNA wybutosine-synthesizing protein 5-like [Ruditapes philippinarum]
MLIPKRMQLPQILIYSILLIVLAHGNDITTEPGHLKPFGEGRPSHPVKQIDYFPTAKEFFENYVQASKPVIMKGVAKMSPAFDKWTDDYFLAQDEPSGNTVSVETRKKESRQQRMDSMSFKDFVKIYNNTEHYMVDAVPKFLRQDVMIPCPLQCEQLVYGEFVDNVMWYSSGGTKSVVHTDSVENINCLYRGEKTLIFVDPEKYGDKVDLDRVEGSYSSMDVDSVDYTKFPGMAEVEFYHVDIAAGDCLYIPYHWIHQVRSYGSNLAVNIWWKHHLSQDLDFNSCTDPCEPGMTLKEADFKGFGDLTADPEEIREHLKKLLGNTGETDITRLTQNLLGPEMKSVIEENEELSEDLDDIFSLLDANKDAIVTKAELDSATKEVLLDIGHIFQAIEEDLEKIYGDGDENYDEDEERDDDHDDDDKDEHDEL